MEAVDVVFVNFRSENDIAASLARLESASLHGLDVTTTVVDCSGMCAEDAVRLQARGGAQVTVIDPGANVGFGPAANIGAARGCSPVLAFLNPDVDLDIEGLAGLIRAGLADRAAGWSGTLRNADGTMQRNAGPSPSLRQLSSEYLLGIDTRYDDPVVKREVAVLTGAVLVVDRQSFDGLGGFAPELPLYMEDVEICRRLADAGRIVQYPIEVGVHAGGRSASHAPRETWLLLHASRVAFFAKEGCVSGVLARAVVLLGVIVRALVRDQHTLAWIPRLVRATAPGFSLASLLPLGRGAPR